ncbi:MAG: hypothetical protein LBC89_02650, partial [Bacteroidales bacterium]|nr:hypothetical protein [Bacteroidales bacterium]
MKKIFFLILFFIVGFSVKTFADINLKFKFEDAATVASIEANTSNSGWAGVYGININNGAVVSDWNTTQPFTKEIINGETWFSYTLVGSPNNPPSGFYMQGKINIGGNFHSQSSGNMLTSFTAETNGDWNLAYNISVEKTWATTTYPVEAVPSYGTLPLNYSSATNGLTLPIGVTSNGIAINNGLQLPTSGGYVQLYFEASNAPKMVEFQFRWGSTNAGHLALIETSVTGDNWVHLDSVGTGTACSHMYGKYATTTPALYSNIIQDHDVKYVRIRAISTANPLYIFGASVRNSYSLSSYDAEFTTNVIPANFANDGSELNVTGGKLKLYKKSQINSASDCPISLLAQNRYRLGGDITYPSVAGDYTAVFTLTTPISAGGACAKILIAGKSSDGTASPIVLN